VDPEGIGFARGWPEGRQPRERCLNVPGVWQAQGVGEPRDHLCHDYVGWGWYRREVMIPALGDHRAWLEVGGAANVTCAFVNGQEIGRHEGFSTPFRFEATSAVRPGRNVIVLAVSNRSRTGRDLPPGRHALEDPTGCFNYLAAWGGIFRPVVLEITAASWIEDCAIRPCPRESRVELSLTVDRPAPGGRVRAEVEGRGTEADVPGDGRVTVSVDVPQPRLWSPETPALYELRVHLISAHGAGLDERRIRFGMRDIRVDGTDILLNGRPYYLNGYGDDAVEVFDGVQPADPEVCRRRLRMMKACGFNAVRHHSWVPTTEYFEAADEEGMLVQIELPISYHNHLLPSLDFFRDEMGRIIRAHRNHPALFAVALGNEFFHHGYPSARGIEFGRAVDALVREARRHFATGLVLSNSGEHLEPTDTDCIRTGAVSPLRKPIIGHEMGDYCCCLPDIYALERLRQGRLLRHAMLERKAAWVAASGWKELYPQIVANSQRLLHRKRKHTMEWARAHCSNCSGYYYWLGTDYPEGGEGDAWYEGVVDFFWEPKGFTPQEMRAFNARTVLALDLFEFYSAWDDEGLRVDLTVSHYGREDIEDGRLEWRITGAGGQPRAAGSLSGVNLKTGSVGLLQPVEIGRHGIKAPEEITLEVRLNWPQGSTSNAWTFWLFPALAGPLSDPELVRSHPALANKRVGEIYPAFPAEGPDPRARVLICGAEALTPEGWEPRVGGFLAHGGCVVLLAQGAGLRGQRRRPYWQDWGLGYGSFVRPHPALARFPETPHCNDLYRRLMGEGAAVLLNGMPTDFVPIIGGVLQEGTSLDPEKKLARFGMVMEGACGGGRVILTTLRLLDGLFVAPRWGWESGRDWPEARHLLESLVAYALSDACGPTCDLSPLLTK
jgi:hypothetical protein